MIVDNFSYQKQTKIEEQEYMKILEVCNLNEEDPVFDQTRYLRLSRIIKQLSRSKRSTQIVSSVLSQIFVTNDAEQLKDEPDKQFECITQKFKLCSDLAMSCKLSTQELLKYCSSQIYGKITFLIILNKETISVLDYFIGITSFLNYILPKSWFYLLKNELITSASLKQVLMRLKFNDKYIVSLRNIKENLYECIAKVAFTSKLSYSQKKNLLQLIKTTFQFETELEFLQLYQSKISDQNGYFESRLMICLIKRLGIPNKYFLEKLLTRAEKAKVLPFHKKKDFFETQLYRKKPNTVDKKPKDFLIALDFLNKEIKKSHQLQASDFVVCLLDTFDFIYPSYFVKEEDKMKRESLLFQYIKTVDLIFQKQLIEDEFFKRAIIMNSIFVLKLGIENKQTVVQSIFSMNILLNAIGLKNTISWLDKFFSLAVHAYLNFPDMKKIQKYTSKIFDYYIKEKQSYTISCFKDIQFVLLKKLSENPLIKETVAVVGCELYRSQEDIQVNLKNHIKSLELANEDIRILNTMYILELLEQQEQDDIRKVLVSPEILKIVYQSILELRQSYKTEKSRILSIICAKCIASIGLCQPFVNDPLTLKASNQQTLINRSKQVTQETLVSSALSNKNTLINQTQKHKVEIDNSLELLALPSLNDLPLEKQSILAFASALLSKLATMTQVTQERPKNYYFTQFLIHKFIGSLKEDQYEENSQVVMERQEVLASSVKKFIDFDLQQYCVLKPYKEKKSLKKFSLYLIAKIDEASWRKLFEACIPLIKTSMDVLELLLPYLIYYALRFNNSDKYLPETIGQHINEILDSDFPSHIEPMLRAQDFLKVGLTQDKMIFKIFLEKQTKFKYVEKLFYLSFDDSKNNDQNVTSFLKIIESDPFQKESFRTVQKTKQLFLQIDKVMKVKAAKLIKNYKKCVYNFEDNYRALINQAGNSGKGFLDILAQEDTIEIVNLHKQLNPEDFDHGLFNSIIQSYKQQNYFFNSSSLPINAFQKLSLTDLDQSQSKFHLILKQFQNHSKIELWKNSQWDLLIECLGTQNLLEIDANVQDFMKFQLFLQTVMFINRESDNLLQQFEGIIGLLLAEYAKGLKGFLKLADLDEEYLLSLQKIEYLLTLVYNEFMLSLDEKQGEISYFYKLFLHVIYEVMSAVYFLKDHIFKFKDTICEILKKEPNPEKRRFELVYSEFDMSYVFERLLMWFEQRSQMIQSSTESLKLINFTRRAIFSLFNRENEYAFYLMRIAQIYRKNSNDILAVNKLLKECESLKDKILDFEYEYSKYTLKTKNAHEAYLYLQSNLDLIKKKCDTWAQGPSKDWMPQMIYQKASLFNLELQIKLDPKNPSIIKKFDDFLKMGKQSWEKPFFVYAQYLDQIDIPSQDYQIVQNQTQTFNPAQDKKKRLIQKIFYYISSLKHGHKYIWQSLPRALELWFDFNDSESDVVKINDFMRQELSKLEVFKLASVLQILLSRYGHTKEAVRETITVVLSKIALQYPGQCAWWIFHFLHFEQESVNSHAANKRQHSVKAQAISRQEFAKALLQRINQQNESVYKKIIDCEKIFLDLKKLSEKNPPHQNASVMEMPRDLQKVTGSNLVMPIEENLSPLLPPLNYQQSFVQTSLVSTNQPITSFCDENTWVSEKKGQGAEENDEEMIQVQTDFAAYNPKPVLIRGFVNEATIMISKERPKKIGIIGSDGQTYNFLLKCDKFGDLRKEQRFIEFAVLCNKMLENDSESRKRNLKLRTYAIVPLSRNTGLIEWIQNTSTLKSIVGDIWKKNNVKGEMQDIKNKANQLKCGDTHTPIWQIVKEEVKPVLGSWMADHFPNPELWYEARINFIRSSAIWSMIGYVIGLGDRHGDNILIHNHTGEVTHVDFDCIFEKGARLKIPEIVPFRLTQNIIDAFGIFKEKGVYIRTCEVVQRVLRKNSNNIISFLYSFIHDPLIENANNIKVDINQALDIVRKKLYGQIAGEKRGSVTIEEQVEQIILSAINDESLSKMYIGWMPWI